MHANNHACFFGALGKILSFELMEILHGVFIKNYRIVVRYNIAVQNSTLNILL